MHAYQTKMEQHIFSYFKIKGTAFLNIKEHSLNNDYCCPVNFVACMV